MVPPGVRGAHPGSSDHLPGFDPQEIHLWFAFPDEIQDCSILADCYELMSGDEKRRLDQLRSADRRHRYLLSRALVRRVLSRYTGTPAPELAFSVNEYGRPELVSPQGTRALRFNLSHTEGLIVLGVVLHQDIGVDVENIERRRVSVAHADRFFTREEARDLHGRGEGDRQARFFDYWTLKESYMKAKGRGLSIGPNQLAFRIADGEPLGVVFSPRLNDVSDLWQFCLLKPTEIHRAAVCVRRHETSGAFRIRLRSLMPHDGEGAYDCPIICCTER
ncbi:MAG: 4'-phosphopantetheinyl transferase sfp [Syntrophorhabdus sp. PtaB.Bin184]|nr:MAG: 4'-phosphopantetheinyl transferase sfp [Syntrophorhabdus sp. PtaB.Bin184]